MYISQATDYCFTVKNLISIVSVLCDLGDNKKWDTPLIPFIPYPNSRQSNQPLFSSRFRGLRPGQRPQLGGPMADPDTGVPVPILGVTIHPQTGQVYPLGGVHVCPITNMPQPIQIGYPKLDSVTGNLVLTVGVSLDPVTGQCSWSVFSTACGEATVPSVR